MHPKSAVILRVLLNKYYKGSPDSFLGCLSEEEIAQVSKVETTSEDPSIALRSSLKKIEQIHYSWFIPYLENLPQNAKLAAIASLPPAHIKMVTQRLKLKDPLPILPKIAQSFLSSLIYKKNLGKEEPLPKEYLPKNPFSILSEMNKNELVEFVEFLGLHDLADELRHVVDQKTLRMVYSCLSQRQQQYLRFCMQQKERVAGQRLGLEKWGGDCEKLRVTLQGRGILRLGKALCGENRDFVWHLAHTFDSGRGQTLIRYYSESPIPGITQTLSQQVQSLLNIYKKKE